MALRVYNTLTRQKEEFQTVVPGKVGMYVCGPTVYKPSHVGHMVGPVIFDTVKRYLSYLGYEVKFVVNITDVDDKLIVRARELNTTVAALAEKMTADYLECLKRLNVTGIDHLPRATDHIPGMIEMMRGLIAKNYAYASGGDVYFDITKDHDYGKLCNRDPEQLEAGARIEVSDRKRNPGDFALWKGSKPGEPAWESPWGPGRPGWHIECSAMSMKLLGETLDIHGGGLDLQFPHHENELAQSESYTGKPFARYWMHNGLLKMGQAKMAGSVGNVINVADLLRQFSPETVRFLLLATHYRSPIEYNEDRLKEIDRSIQAFYRFFMRYKRLVGENFYSIDPFKGKEGRPPLGQGKIDERIAIEGRWVRFQECMDDDFNTGGAIGVLHETLGSLNRLADRIESPDRYTYSGPRPSTESLRSQLQEGGLILRTMGFILGLFRDEAPPPTFTGTGSLGLGEVQVQGTGTVSPPPEMTVVNNLIDFLIQIRAEARKVKNFALGDQIRARLQELGIILEDRAGATEWRRA